jgi:hypothetical protein
VENTININLEISNEDIEFLKTYIKDKFHPVEFDEIVYQIALFKTREKRKSKVKLYDPSCEYAADDLIYKEYPGNLPVGGKKFIHTPLGVILKVEEARTRMGRNEIRLSYDGTSDFRKYTEYLKKQKIELILPHKQASVPSEPEYLTESEDPRTQQAPLIERDFSILRKKITTALNKEPDIAFISHKVMLKKNLKQLKPEIFDAIKDFLKTHQVSESTEFFVRNFAKIEPESPDFDAYCFTLNSMLTQNYKIDLQQTNTVGWGKWHLISVLYQLKKNALVSEPNPLLSTVQLKNRKNLLQRRRQIEEAIFSEGDTRYFLTQREITSGALRLKPGMYDFGETIEVEVLDSNSKKAYVLYYYQNENLLLGFDKIFENYRAIQGMTLVLEQDEDKKLHFSIKTTKKGTIAEKIVYDREKKLFHATEEKIASPVFVNKTLYLEPDVFHTIENQIGEFRKLDTLNKLIHKIFLEFGVKERNYEIHILRLYHILDLICAIDLRQVGEIILSNPEFIPAEKIVGVFYLDSDAVVEIEEEERDRRQRVIEDNKKKREESRRQQIEEELKKKDDIRHLREERKKKREEEMRMHDQLLKEKEQQKKDDLLREEAKREREAASAERPFKNRDDAEAPAQRRYPREFKKPETPFEPHAAADAQRKTKKKLEPEKSLKVSKKGQKKIIEEKIELDEIKKEILHQDLKKEAQEPEGVGKKETSKETQVAYKDAGGFGGIFASKLDEIVQKDDDKEKKKSGKK